jgi:uncharacterized protein
MHIWVDADACPKIIKEILYRAVKRTKTLMTLVANQPLSIPSTPFIRTIQVPAGFDVADNKIIQNLEQGDLVITADIPLADAVIDKGGIAIDPRGKLYTKNNIKERLSMRNFSAELRGAGVLTGGPAKLGKRETEAFANALDKFLATR